jgi:putative protease
MPERLMKVGDIDHYYTNIEVAVVDLVSKLQVGDKITVKGATTEFTQIVKSMQIMHEAVEEAHTGDSIGLKVNDRVRKGDEVFKTIDG